MKKWFRIAASFLLILFLATGCASGATPEASPGPEASPTAPQTTAAPKNQAEVYTLAGKAADIHVGGKKVPGKGYYMGEGEEALILPFVEVCKGLGWAVTEPQAEGPVEIQMSKSGEEAIVVSFTRPAGNFSPDVGAVQVKKAGEDVRVNEMKTMPFIEGLLYANEGFISEAVEKVEIKYDGETLISVEPSA